MCGAAAIYLDQLLPVGSPPLLSCKSKKWGKRPTRWIDTRAGLTSFLGLAGGGVCPASAVTGTAVRSYRTISPLPREITSRRSLLPTPAHYLTGLCIFCGAFPAPVSVFDRRHRGGGC